LSRAATRAPVVVPQPATTGRLASALSTAASGYS